MNDDNMYIPGSGPRRKEKPPAPVSWLMHWLTCTAPPQCKYHLAFYVKYLSCNHPVCINCIPFGEPCIGMKCDRCRQPNRNDLVDAAQTINLNEQLNLNINAATNIFQVYSRLTLNALEAVKDMVSSQIDDQFTLRLLKMNNIYDRMIIDTSEYYKPLKEELGKLRETEIARYLDFDRTGWIEALEELNYVERTKRFELRYYKQYNESLLWYYQKQIQLEEFEPLVHLGFRPFNDYCTKEVNLEIIQWYKTLQGMLRSAKTPWYFDTNCTVDKIIKISNAKFAVFGSSLDSDHKELHILNYEIKENNLSLDYTLQIKDCELLAVASDDKRIYLNAYKPNKNKIYMVFINDDGDKRFKPHLYQYTDLLCDEDVMYGCVKDEPKLCVIRTEDFQIIEEINLDFIPIQVQCYDGIIGLRSKRTDPQPKIQFLDVNTGEILFEYNDYYGYLFTFRDNFYSFSRNGRCYLFNAVGQILNDFRMYTEDFIEDLSTVQSMCDLEGLMVFGLEDNLLTVYNTIDYIETFFP